MSPTLFVVVIADCYLCASHSFVTLSYSRTFSFACCPIVTLESRAILVSLVTGTVTLVYYPTAQNRV